MYNIRTQNHLLIASVSDSMATRMINEIGGQWRFHQTRERGANQQVFFFTEMASWGKFGEIELQIYEDYYMVQR